MKHSLTVKYLYIERCPHVLLLRLTFFVKDPLAADSKAATPRVLSKMNDMIEEPPPGSLIVSDPKSCVHQRACRSS